MLVVRGREKASALGVMEMEANSYPSCPRSHFTDSNSPPPFRPAQCHCRIYLEFMGNLMPFVLVETEVWKTPMKLSRESIEEREPNK